MKNQEFDIIQITITGDKKSTFVKAVELAMWEHSFVDCYTFKDGVVTLYWHEDTYAKTIPLLYKMNAEQAGEYLWGLIKSLPVEVYGKEPDTDGSTARGWEITNVRHYSYRVFSIKPHWNIYGK